MTRDVRPDRRQVSIGGRPVGTDCPPYIVAELSANHCGSLDRALRIMEAAKEAGADAVKLQTYTADTITLDHHGPGFSYVGGLWDGRSLHELYQEAHTPWEWHDALFAKGQELGLDVFSSPFDPSAVDFLERFNPPAYKIASFECVDLPLIRYVAGTGKPLVISTGMANRDEIQEALDTAITGGSCGVVLLHAVSGYPSPPADSNLRTIPDMRDRFGVPVGLSDHTLGIAVPIAAVSLGAAMIEKHVTMRRADGGPDSAFSLEPEELRDMSQACRIAYAALGNPSYERAPSEEGNVQFRRSLYVVQDIIEGEVFTTANIRSIRPGFGLAPKLLPDVLGRRARRKLSRGTPLSEDAVDWAGDR